MLLVSGELNPRASIAVTAPRRGLVGKAPRDVVATAGARQRCRRHPPWLARGAIAAGQAQRRETAEPLATRAVDVEQLAAPCGAVGAETDAVERKPQHRHVDAVLGGHRRDVRMVMLDGERRDAPACGERAPRAACRRNPDAGRARRLDGSTSRIATRCATACSSATQVGALSRSPTCCETNASSPRVTHTVLLKWPPSATTGGPAVASRIARGV